MSTVNALSSTVLVSEKRQNKRVFLLLGILVVFAPLLIVGLFGEWLGDGTLLGGALINLAYIMSVLSATAVLKWYGIGWRDIGMARPASWPKTVLLGFGTLVVFIVASNVLGAAIQYFLAPDMAAPDRSSLNPLDGNLLLLILMVVAAWTTIALGEEMIFRAFLTNSLAGFFPQSRAKWAFALIGSSLLFGLAHFSYGLAGIIETTIIGLVLNIAYLSTGRNLWVTIIAHGIVNTLSFILIYSGAA